jgi:hypothetical protein
LALSNWPTYVLSESEAFEFQQLAAAAAAVAGDLL